MLLLATGCVSNTETGQTTAPVHIDAASSPDPQAIPKAEEFLRANGPAEQARQVVIEDCMAKAGFEWTRLGQDETNIEDLIPLRPLSLAQARTDGYTDNEQNQNPMPEEPQEPGAREAFSGSPTSPRTSIDVLGMKPSVSSQGCLAESYTKVYDSIERGMMATGVTANALLPFVNAAIADPSIEEANKKWASCMEDSGQPNLPTPDMAWNMARQNPDDAGEIAVTDAKCRESVTYEDIRKSALNSYLTTFLDTNEALITEIQEIRKQGAAHAEKILSGE